MADLQVSAPCMNHLVSQVQQHAAKSRTDQVSENDNCPQTNQLLETGFAIQDRIESGGGVLGEELSTAQNADDEAEWINERRRDSSQSFRRRELLRRC